MGLKSIGLGVMTGGLSEIVGLMKGQLEGPDVKSADDLEAKAAERAQADASRRAKARSTGGKTIFTSPTGLKTKLGQ